MSSLGQQVMKYKVSISSLPSPVYGPRLCETVNRIRRFQPSTRFHVNWKVPLDFCRENRMEFPALWGLWVVLQVSADTEIRGLTKTAVFYQQPSDKAKQKPNVQVRSLHFPTKNCKATISCVQSTLGKKKTVSTLSILSYCTGELNVDIPLVPCKDLFTIGGLNEGMCVWSSTSQTSTHYPLPGVIGISSFLP